MEDTNNNYDAFDSTIEQNEIEKPDNEQTEKICNDISQMKEDLSYLRDLFVRRLNDDKQKSMIIKKLAEGATFAYIEPFLYDIILLLDRLEKKKDDDFVDSVIDELYSIINRRGVKKITNTASFDPNIHKAVSVIESPETAKLFISKIIRNGYEFSGKVIRPVEVEVTKPAKAMEE